MFLWFNLFDIQANVLWIGNYSAVIHCCTLQRLNNCCNRAHTPILAPTIAKGLANLHYEVGIVFLGIDIDDAAVGGLESYKCVTYCLTNESYTYNPGVDVLFVGICHQVDGEIETHIIRSVFIPIGVVV